MSRAGVAVADARGAGALGALRHARAAPGVERGGERRRPPGAGAAGTGGGRRQHGAHAPLPEVARLSRLRLGSGAQSRPARGRVRTGARHVCASSVREHGRPVSLIGWSLGGLYARELAKQSPEMVRLVITSGSPFTGHPRETNAWRLYEFASGHRIDSHDFHGPLAGRPARADDLDLEPDRRRRRVALQRRDAPRCWRKTSSSNRATSASARIRRRSTRSPTGSRSRRASGSRSTARGGGVSSIATRAATGSAARDRAGAFALAARRSARDTRRIAASGASQDSFARSFFLSTLPTEVSGSSATKVTFSGIAIFEMRPRST